MAGTDRVRREGIGRWLAGDAPAGAALFTYAALIPLFVLPALDSFDFGVRFQEAETARWASLGYAALFIAGLAGIRIGATLRVGRNGHVLALFAPLAAFGCFFAPFRPAAAIIAMLFAAQAASDVWASQNGRLPDWYGQLRARTAPIAVLALVAIFLLVPD